MDDPLTRREVLTIGAAATGLGALTPHLSKAPTISAPDLTPIRGTLRQIADRKGLLCGTAVPADVLVQDGRFRDVLRSDANILVPENELKWSRLQPTRDGPLNFGPAEAIYDFAKTNGMQMRGHTLSWWNGQPAWAKELIPTLSPGKAGDLLVRYVTDVMTHWRGRLVHWDVVNEPIVATGELVDTLMAPKLGERYIDLAFHAAREADPDALRVFNQTLVAQEDWWEDRQQAATLRLVERLMGRGVPIQAFGYEAHVMTERKLSEAKWRRFLDALTGMGLKIVITELDVNDRGTPGDPAKRDAESAALVTQLLDITLSYSNCLGLLTWGPVDRYNWLRKMTDRARVDGALHRPTPRDDNYAAKPMWNAIARAIERSRPDVAAAD